MKCMLTSSASLMEVEEETVAAMSKMFENDPNFVSCTIVNSFVIQENSDNAQNQTVVRRSVPLQSFAITVSLTFKEIFIPKIEEFHQVSNMIMPLVDNINIDKIRPLRMNC